MWGRRNEWRRGVQLLVYTSIEISSKGHREASRQWHRRIELPSWCRGDLHIEAEVTAYR